MQALIDRTLAAAGVAPHSADTEAERADYSIDTGVIAALVEPGLGTGGILGRR